MGLCAEATDEESGPAEQGETTTDAGKNEPLGGEFVVVVWTARNRQ